jgi:hypothetical protein
MDTIASNRKKISYRFLEGLLGYITIAFLGILILLAFVNPTILSIFLIAYSFLMVFKTGLHGIYTIYTYKTLKRWDKLEWLKLISDLESNRPHAYITLEKLAEKYRNQLDWHQRLTNDIKQLKLNENTKFENPNKIVQIPLFAVYNESVEVITRSLKQIYNSKYNLENLFVFVSQEARVGEQITADTFEKISKLDWVNAYNIGEQDLDIVYDSNHLELQYSNKILDKIKPKKNKLTIIFTQHPDGLVGEIKGKASNEDWGARQASLFIKAKKIDPEMVVLTSLDADSKVGKNFFQMLAFRYCITPSRLSSGFQPLPVYANNFFNAHMFPRLVAANTTIWYMIQSSLVDELHFFANYCVPLKVLQKVDFWNREVIAEDSLLFAKCYVAFEGNFSVVPFYGTFEGDAVVGDDYFETILNQYKQLQRWAWGGIEGFPYKFKKFFLDPSGSKIDLRKRLNMIRLEVMSHFFWATSPIVFSVVVFLPFILSDRVFRESPVQNNLWLFSQYFAWLSFIFLAISSYITFTFTAYRAHQVTKGRWYNWFLVGLQWFVSPMIFIMWGPPALDVQLRGILGKYLGYWVTPKK